MIISPPNLTLLSQGFNAAFMRGFEGVTPTWPLLAVEIPSSSKAENYGWLEDLPGMRQWVGQREYLNLQATSVSVENLPFEHTIAVKRTDIVDDNLGMYSNLFAVQGELVARHPDTLMWGLLQKGRTTRGFDGQYFFDTDHVTHTRDGKETSWSNTQGGTGPSWYVADLSRTHLKPLLFQMRERPVFVPRKNPDDPRVFDMDEHVYGVHARYNGAFAFHQLIVESGQPLTAENYAAARLALTQQFRKDGSPLGVRATHLIVGQTNDPAARELLVAERNAAGATNIWRGSAELHSSLWLP